MVRIASSTSGRRILEARCGNGPGDQGLSPATLFDNPLFVWGGAILEGYFTKAEFPLAVSAVEQQFQSLSEDEIEVCLNQMYGLMVAMNAIEGMSLPPRIAMFCDATGRFEARFSPMRRERNPMNSACSSILSGTY